MMPCRVCGREDRLEIEAAARHASNRAAARWHGLSEASVRRHMANHGGLIGSVITLILAHVAYRQLYSLSLTASGDFILKMKRDFFQEETRRLMHFVTEDWIEFVDVKGSEHFRVKEEEVKGSELHAGIKDWLLKVRAYSAFDVDDMLLGHFEDLAMLWDDHVLNINMIHKMFSGYIETVWQNCEVQRYIRNQRNNVSPDIYEGFERLYDECRRFPQTR
jgi:hypothetical protein